MQPITEEQEWTLRRWASTVGKRPRKRDKAFLQAEKGLTEEQIDTWWKGVDRNHEEVRVAQPPQPAVEALTGVSSFGSDHLLTGGIQESHSFSALQVEAAGGTFANFEHSFPIVEQNWSPICTSEEYFSNLTSSLIALPQDTHPWPSMGCAQRGLLRSTTSSLSETSPLLSSPFSNWNQMNNSDRSSTLSHGSSLRTWDTASTLVSFCDPYLENAGQNGLYLEKDSLMIEAPSKLHPENSSFEIDTSVKASSHRRKPSKDQCNAATEAPKPTTNGLQSGGKYTCTTCHRSFNRKGDWERHEESQHDPQRYWICMHGDPAISIPSGLTSVGGSWICAFCDTSKTSRETMVEHLIRRHKINVCIRKGRENRTFTRKDKLKQHLLQVHALGENCVRWEAWSQPAAPRKWAWGCGFCGACSFTWDGRLAHIAEHYERQNLPISQWSQSLVIKGLLKQFSTNYNISIAWKNLVGWKPNSDLLLEWSDANAAILKHRLEFHQGTPVQLAHEAQRLARGFRQEHVEDGWSMRDSRVATLTSPALLMDPGTNIWPKSSPNITTTPGSYSMPRDVEMQEQMPSFI